MDRLVPGGGLIALEVALKAPERFRVLILLTATPRFVRVPDWPAATDADVLARFHDGLLADPTGTLERFLALQVMGSEAARDNLRTLRRELAHRPEPVPAALALGLDLLRDTDLRGRIGALACPTLWLFGRRDTLVPAATGEGIARGYRPPAAPSPPPPGDRRRRPRALPVSSAGNRRSNRGLPAGGPVLNPGPIDGSGNFW